MSYPILAPNSTWFTQGGTTITRASITEINIVDNYTPTGSENDSWDASAAKDGSVMCYVTGTTLTIAGNGSGKISLNADSHNVFSDVDATDFFIACTTINGLPNIDASNATTLKQAFFMMNAITALDIGGWDISNITDLSICFTGCVALSSLDLSQWNVSNVETMYYMFGGHSYYGGDMAITSIGDVSGWNTSKLTDVRCLFQNCSSLASLDMSNWDVSKVTRMHYAFSGCSSLTSIGDTSNWDTSSCTDMSFMFYRCTSLVGLDVSNWDTSSCTNMSSMFQRCTSLVGLDVSNWDTSKVTTMGSMFSMNDYGSPEPNLTQLNVSNWDTSACTDMSFLFYGCNGVDVSDVSNWDVSKVTSFDHMMAHTYIILKGIENWQPSSACINMNAMFHSIQNTTIDVSKFDTSNVQFFSQMFQNANKLTKIIGLENFVTSNALGFEEMFQYCSALKELNLSSFDTSKAKDGVTGSTNGHITATMQNMFQDNYALEKITLGANFTFKGDGTTTNTSHYAVLHSPSSTYIPGADGNWYTRHREPYAASAIPDNTAETYYASLDIVNAIDFLIKNGTLLDMSDKIRVLSGAEETMTPAEMQTELDTFNTDMNTVVTEQDNLIAQLYELIATKACYNTIYVGTTAPTDDIGVDGDFYIVRGEA